MKLSELNIKVCGLKDPVNVRDISQLGVDYMGFIFYPKSPRFVENRELLKNLFNTNKKKVGVFVNTSQETVLETIKDFKLEAIQLHDDESPEYCAKLRRKTSVELIKAINIADKDDFQQCTEYKSVIDYFLFDTRTATYGGSGKKFNWDVLQNYNNHTPFFLSGGIGPEDVDNIQRIKHPCLHGIDINSRFELTPGLKDTSTVEKFINELKTTKENVQ